MYSDMSMRTIACSSSNRKPASALVSSVLPTPVGPRNMKDPMGRFGSCSPARERLHRSGHRDHGLFLAHDALAEILLHLQKLLALAFQHLVDRNAGPARHDLGHMAFGHGFLEHLRRRSGASASFSCFSRPGMVE